MRFLLILAGALLTGACAIGPSQEEIDAANYGPEPSNPEELAEDWITPRLIDPESARFQHDKVFKGYANYREDYKDQTAFGWMQCGTVNAKNRMGGYTGHTPYYVLIKNDAVVRGDIDSESNRQFHTYKNCENVVEE